MTYREHHSTTHIEQPHGDSGFDKMRMDAQKAIEVMKEGFVELINSLKKEKPSKIVFLDKGARVLAAPFHKFISHTFDGYSPEILFFNDTNVKDSSQPSDENMPTNTEDFFAALSEEKVFFVDETFSEGRGATAIKNMMSKYNIQGRYFGLSRTGTDEEMKGFFANYAPEGMADYISIVNDERFFISSAVQDDMIPFIDQISSLYVEDAVDGAGTVHTTPRFKNSNSVTKKESLEVVRDVKKLIYESLLSLKDKQ